MCCPYISDRNHQYSCKYYLSHSSSLIYSCVDVVMHLGKVLDRSLEMKRAATAISYHAMPYHIVKYHIMPCHVT